MKQTSKIQVVSATLSLLLLLGGCQSGDGKQTQASISTTSVTRSNAQTPITVDPGLSRTFMKLDTWELPAVQEGSPTLGSLIHSLGITQSNGLTLNTWNRELSSHDRYLSAQNPLVQEALQALLALPVDCQNPLEQTPEPYRMKLQLYAGVLPGLPNLGTKALELLLPSTASEEGVAIHVNGSEGSSHQQYAQWDSAGKAQWQRPGEGEKNYRLKGYPAWEKRYGQKLLDTLAKEGKAGSLLQAAVQPVSIQSKNTGSNPQTVADFSFQMGVRTAAFSYLRVSNSTETEKSWQYFGTGGLLESSPEQRYALEQLLTLPFEVVGGDPFQWDCTLEKQADLATRSEVWFQSVGPLAERFRGSSELPLSWRIFQTSEQKMDEVILVFYTEYGNGVEHLSIGVPQAGATAQAALSLEVIPLVENGGKPTPVRSLRLRIPGYERWLENLHGLMQRAGALDIPNAPGETAR